MSGFSRADLEAGRNVLGLCAINDRPHALPTPGALWGIGWGFAKTHLVRAPPLRRQYLHINDLTNPPPIVHHCHKSLTKSPSLMNVEYKQLLHINFSAQAQANEHVRHQLRLGEHVGFHRTISELHLVVIVVAAIVRSTRKNSCACVILVLMEA